MPASKKCARRSRKPRSAAISSARARCCSSTRSIGSRRRSKTRCLPHVESGTVTLIGATTENPSFGVVAALLSRCRVVRLEALDEAQLAELVARALADTERGLGTLDVAIDAETTAQLVAAAAGDARRLYSVLDVAADLARRATPERHRARSPPSTSPRRRRASRCSTTRPATSTTASCRRSSRACAARIPTPRCTG